MNNLNKYLKSNPFTTTNQNNCIINSINQKKNQLNGTLKEKPIMVGCITNNISTEKTQKEAENSLFMSQGKSRKIMVYFLIFLFGIFVLGLG
jgi:hypothetical protein